MMGPGVSVVVGVRDGLPYLDSALRSVLSQEGVDLELIVVDDGSTDDTPRVLDRLCTEDSRIRVLRQENRGLTMALIAGCEIASGRYIARQDSDDISLSGRLAAQVEMLDRDERVSFVSCSGVAIGPEGELLLEEERPGDPEEATRGLRQGRIGPSGHGSVMFRANDYRAVGGYRPEFRFVQDWDLWFRLVERGLFACVPRPLYAFRVREGAIGEARRQQQEGLFGLAEECRDRRSRGLTETDCLRRAREISDRPTNLSSDRTSDATYFIGRCLFGRRDRRAKQYLARRLRRAPFDVKAWVAYGLALALARSPGRTISA